MTFNRNIELLAPAGSVTGLKAVIAAGADAVYIGGSRFGARAYAANPGEDDLLAAIDYAHLRGVKVYMTVNTLLKDSEMEDLYDYMLPYYTRGVDAVLVQDFGVLRFLHRCFPDLPLHASTQMTVTGPESARLLKKYGVDFIAAPLGNTNNKEDFIRNQQLQLPDMGSYTISKNTVLAKKIATDYLADLIEKWKQDPTAPENNKPVHINITGHSRGAVAASETVAEVSDWLSQQKGCEDFAKNVDFRLLLRDPVPGPDVLDERRRQPDLSRIPNLETTTIYTTATHKDVFGKAFRPQKTRGQERIIIGTTPHSLGLEGVDKSQMSYKDDGVAHQWGYFNAENKQYYRGSGINDLPEGVYLTDEKRNLIRVTKYSQVDNVMNLVNQHSQILIDNDQRQKDLRNVVRNWFVDNPQHISFRRI